MDKGNKPLRRKKNNKINPVKLRRGDLGSKSLNIRDIWNRLEDKGEFVVLDRGGAVLGLVQRDDVFDATILREIAFAQRAFLLIPPLRDFQRWRKKIWSEKVMPAQIALLENWWAQNHKEVPFEYEKIPWDKTSFEDTWQKFFLNRYKGSIAPILEDIKRTHIALRNEAPSTMTKGRNDFWNVIDRIFYDYKDEKTREEISKAFTKPMMFLPEIVYFEYLEAYFYFTPVSILQGISKTIKDNFQIAEILERNLGVKFNRSEKSAIYHWQDAQFIDYLPVDWKFEAARQKETNRTKSRQKKEKEKEALEALYKRISESSDFELFRLKNKSLSNREMAQEWIES